MHPADIAPLVVNRAPYIHRSGRQRSVAGRAPACPRRTPSLPPSLNITDQSFLPEVLGEHDLRAFRQVYGSCYKPLAASEDPCISVFQLY